VNGSSLDCQLAPGARGRVDIRIKQELDTVVEITDNGPGFGGGPPGVAGLGFTVLSQLLDAAGGRLDVSNGPDGGARARVTFGLDREYLAAAAGAGSWRWGPDVPSA
jgi:signal transduction histidine kinase